MDFTALASMLVSIVLIPPTSLLLLALAGHLLRGRWPRTGTTLRAGALLTLLVLSTSAGSLLLVQPLEDYTRPLAAADLAGVQAIVVLAAGAVSKAPEYNADVPDDIGLVRLQYAAYLQHASNLPLLVSGGNGSSRLTPKALSMAQVLRHDFRTPVTWIEARSATTAQNATFSAAMLKQAGIRRIVLVTHAMHMARAEGAFRAAGLDVVAAPTMFYGNRRLSAFMFLPSANGLHRSSYACHEWIGLLWYKLRAQTKSGQIP